MAVTMKRRRSQTRERLIDAAREVLADEGIQGASVELICERAGFTRGAFYSNFGSKDDLVFAVFEREKTELLVNLRRAVGDEDDARTDDPSALVARVVESFLELQATDRTSFIVHAEFALHSIRNTEVAAVYAEAIDVWTQELARTISSVLDLLGLRLIVDIEPVIAIVVGAFEYIERNALIRGEEADHSTLTATLPQVLLAITEPVDAPRT